MSRFFLRSFVLFTCLSHIACNSLYFASMEKLGYAKRDLMVSRIHEANDSQKAAKKQFENALEEFKSVVRVQGGDIEAKYSKLKRELDRTEAKAADLKTRVERIEEVSDALFSEWKKELRSYENKDLMRRSEVKLAQTRDRYRTMIEVMQKATSRLDPALQPLRDNVLFLKHNLNAKAIGSLGEESSTVESNIDDLVLDLDRSIAEAQSFVETLKE